MLSPERLGKFTASNIWKLFVEGKGTTRLGYIIQVAEEKVMGLQAPEKKNKYTEHGIFNEYEALEALEKITGFNVQYLDQKFFPINDDCGATPDAACLDFDDVIKASVDAKCPVTDFFKQKLMIMQNSKPEFQNSPRESFYQAQTQMMALKCEDHYLVRYLTSTHVDDWGNKHEFNLSLEVRTFYKHITADKEVQEQIMEKVAEAAKERDKLVEMFMQVI